MAASGKHWSTETPAPRLRAATAQQREQAEKYRVLLQTRIEVIGSCAGVWSRFAKMKARQQELGAIVADLDLLIAATAAHHQWTVVTLNSRDFSRIEGIAWEEWSAVS